jgi:dienelactone hydrolase
MRLLSGVTICWLLISCSDQNNTAPNPLGAAGVPSTVPTAGNIAPPAGAGAAPVAGTPSTTGVAGTSSSATAGRAAVAGSNSSSAAGSGAAGTPAAAAGASGSSVAGASGSSVAGASGMTATNAGAGGAPTTPDTTIMGCGSSKLLQSPADLTARGPWPVGEKTVKVGRLNNVEVMYPAKLGSEQGKEVLKFDLRTFLPMGEEAKVPDAEATIIDQQTYADLPLDEEHGPYPVVIFVHGTASFRIGSFSTQALWASRGFVVVAADHPGLYLGDYLGTSCGINVPAEDLSGDVDAEIAALTSTTGDLAFLANHIDMQRLGLAGHSAGAYAVAQFSTKPGVQMVVPLSGTRAVARSATLKSVLYVSGIADTVLPYATGGTGIGTILYPGTGTDAYNASPGPPGVKKRITGITGGGHLVVTDLCRTGPKGKSDLDTAAAHNVCGAASLMGLGLADCGMIDREKGTKIVNDITTGALEETLQCLDRAASISALKSRYPEVGDFKEATQ